MPTLTIELPPQETQTFSAVDVTSDEQVRTWAARWLKAHRAPDLLLNNSGVINRNAPLWTIKAVEFDAVIDTNIKGGANVIRHFAPALIGRGSGVIVNFSSGWGRSTDADVAPYCATKWAIEGLARSLAQALPAGMAAIALNPGIIDTDLLRSRFGGSASSFPSATEWAGVAVPFLLELGRGDNWEPLAVPIRRAND